jgi:hypothetical protein
MRSAGELDMVNLTDIFDTGLDIITFGMYKGVKGMADGANQSIKTVSEDLAKGITELTNKTLLLMSDLDTVLKDADGLFYEKSKVKRMDSELSPDELTTVKMLKQLETGLVGIFNSMGEKGIIDDFTLQFYLSWKSDVYAHGAMPIGWTDAQMDKAKYYAQKLKLTRNAIDRIYYKGSGAVPATLTELKNVLNRVNTQEQPRLEKLMDNVNGSVLSTQKVIDRLHTEEQPRVEKLLDNVNNTVTETQTVLKNVNTSVAEAKVLIADVDRSVKRINGGLNLVSKYKMIIMSVIVLTAIMWVAISALILLILVKILLGYSLF